MRQVVFVSSNKNFVGNIAVLCNYMRPQLQNINVCVFHHCHSPHQKLLGEWVQAFGASEDGSIDGVVHFFNHQIYNCIRFVYMCRFYMLWWMVNLVHQYRILYGAFSHDVTAAILVSQNNETAAMLVSQTNPLGVELFSYANAFFCSNKFA